MRGLHDRLPAVGFVASETSKNGELAVSARHCAATGAPLVISSGKAVTLSKAIAATGATTVVDTRGWHAEHATVDVPTDLDDGLPLYTLDEWGQAALSSSGAAAVLTPSRFLGTDRAARQSLLRATENSTVDGLVTFLPLDAAVLVGESLAELIEDLRATNKRQFAFVFAGPKRPLENYRRLVGLRRLLAEFSGSWVFGVDALVGTDCLAHGAGLAAVGSSSGRRWPHRPSDAGGGSNAAGYLPGLFLVDIFEFRSPMIYADWYANAPSPMCRSCHRTLDLFEPTGPDKEAIIAHNLHQISDLAADLLAHDSADQADWLNRFRVQCFETHQQLNGTGAEVVADPTLLHLCSMDDPQMRTALKTGHWQ